MAHNPSACDCSNLNLGYMIIVDPVCTYQWVRPLLFPRVWLDHKISQIYSNYRQGHRCHIQQTNSTNQYTRQFFLHFHSDESFTKVFVVRHSIFTISYRRKEIRTYSQRSWPVQWFSVRHRSIQSFRDPERSMCEISIDSSCLSEAIFNEDKCNQIETPNIYCKRRAEKNHGWTKDNENERETIRSIGIKCPVTVWCA